VVDKYAFRFEIGGFMKIVLLYRLTFSEISAIRCKPD